MDWDRIPDEAIIRKTMEGLKTRNFNPMIVEDKATALAKLKAIIPNGADIMEGSSTTLIEIGFIDYLVSGKHPWQNWKDRIFAEKDPVKQRALRRESTCANYFLGSVQAITEDGIVLGVDATGSRQGGYVFSAEHVIRVTGVNKIVPDVDSAFKRLHEHCIPMENERVKKAGDTRGTYIGKAVLYEHEGIPGRVTTILIRESLGF
jgi:hypothetical protein